MKKKFTNKFINAVEPAAPASVWGRRPCADKGGKTQNSIIINSTKKETD